jgi:surfactin synthase thioesterase subunit
MQPSTESPWFPAEAMNGTPELLLFCLHHAGAGASAYRNWQKLIGRRIEVVPVQLPGREGRFTEPAERSITRLAERLQEPLLQRAGGTPFALFGHSMGAVLAYELSHRLTRAGRPPAHLAVSAYAPPHIRVPTHVHTLSDQEFLDYVAGLEGTVPAVLESPELLELLLPVLRVDFAACDSYAYVERGRLGVPLTAFGGDSDPGVSVPMLERWAELTSGPVGIEVFPGGHFYLLDQLEAVLDVLTGKLGIPRE